VNPPPQHDGTRRPARVAVAQMAPEQGATARNVDRVVERLGEAATRGAQLVVFPECALSGYLVDDIDELERVAEPIPGRATQRLAEACARWRVHAVVGILEQGTDAIYNSAVLIGPGGVVGRYRKAHLPGLGLDRLVAHGNTPFAVYETPVGRVGLAICYDLRFPEAARLLALQGADLIAIPTAWPVMDRLAPPSTIPDVLTRARACENRVFLAVADRVGQERGRPFLGRSQLVDVFGGVVAEGGTGGEEILEAEFDLALARQKDFVYVPGEFETHWFGDRRTDLYAPLADPNLWPQSPRRPREALAFADGVTMRGRTTAHQARKGVP
jgi:5-aminopentanamidase